MSEDAGSDGPAGEDTRDAPGYVLGGRVRDALPPTLAERVEGLVRGVLETGEPVLGLAIETATRAHPDERRRHTGNCYGVRGADGTVAGGGVIVAPAPGADG